MNLAVTPDGKRLMTSGQRTMPRSETSLRFGPEQVTMAEIYFYDLHTGERERELQGDDWYSFGNAALSPDGKRIALAEFSRLQILDAETGKMVRSFELPGEWGSPPQFSPDGSRVYMPLDNSIGVFDIEAGELLHDSSPRGMVHSLAWSPNGKQMATGHRDGNLRAWDTTTGTLLWSEQLAPVISRSGWKACPYFVGYTADPTRLVVAGRRDDPVDYRDGIVVVFDANTGERLREIIVDAEVCHAALSPDGGRIVVASLDDTRLQGIDLATGEVLFLFPAVAEGEGGLWYVRSLAFTPQGELLVSLHGGETFLLDIASGEVRHQFVADYREAVRSDQKRLQIGNADFNAERTVLVANSAEWVHIWSLADGKLRNTIRHPHDNGSMVEASPNGKTIATADVNYAGDPGDDVIRLFNTETGEQVTTFERPRRRASKLRFSSDGGQLMAGFNDGSVVVWNLDAK